MTPKYPRVLKQLAKPIIDKRMDEKSDCALRQRLAQGNGRQLADWNHVCRFCGRRSGRLLRRPDADSPD
jgi:hypothetical protein